MYHGQQCNIRRVHTLGSPRVAGGRRYLTSVLKPGRIGDPDLRGSAFALVRYSFGEHVSLLRDVVGVLTSF